MIKRKGFTLIEVLIVTSIISIIILAGFFLARSQYLKGRDARRKADIHKIQEALEEYEKDHDCYPQPELVVCNPGTGLVPYLSKVPCDFATGGNYFYENDNDTCAKWYRIFIILDNLNDKDIIPGIGPGNNYNFYLSSPNAPVPASTSPSPTPTPVPPSCEDYWGCKDGVCTLIPRELPDCLPVCQPGYDSLNICNLSCPGLECN